jgi:general secretion pathway protein C
MAGRALPLGGTLDKVLGTVVVAAPDEESPADNGGGQYRLLGVVAPRGAAASTQGVALISIGEQPAKAWRTGAVIEGETVLLSVGKRSAQLGPRGGPVTTELTLPEPSVAANNNLPPVGAPGYRPGFNPQGQAFQPNLQHQMAPQPLPTPKQPAADDDEE